MASDEDKQSLARVSRDPRVVVVKPPPPFPKDFTDRFESMREWEQAFKKYMVEDLGLTIKGGV